jgi:tryptophan synthase alpha subunit
MAMNNLDKKLLEIKKRSRIGLMTHVIVGYPSIDETVQLVKTMSQNGADIIELQIPFSDPLADGPTIMKACEKSLANGTKVKDAFGVLHRLTNEVTIPLLFMAYYNTVFVYGVEKFCKSAKAAGASGLIVPDMPIEEEQQEHFFKACKKYKLAHIQVISPASTDLRLKKNARIANGFIYCTARQGTTGAKDMLDPKVRQYLKKIKQVFEIPIAVGFGISKSEQIRELTGYADIVVVGSKIIDVIENSPRDKLNQNIANFLQSLLV